MPEGVVRLHPCSHAHIPTISDGLVERESQSNIFCKRQVRLRTFGGRPVRDGQKEIGKVEGSIEGLLACSGTSGEQSLIDDRIFGFHL